MGFEQATIKVEKEAEFEELKAAIERSFRPESVEQFLKRLSSEGLRVRDWDAVVSKRVLEKVDSVLAKSGKKASELYQALSLSDQAQMREFYLFRIEEVDPKLRAKFHKIYQYY
jgi:DNA-binding HxlR family transcriptional regulator